MVQISEKEFMKYEQRRLEVLADTIRDCKISLYEISKGTRIKYDTLLRAMRRQPIRPENEHRIRIYICRHHGMTWDDIDNMIDNYNYGISENQTD